uniref:Reverse transcriptase domain-containing protein n=1 Tax=Rhabditophanes sp. KR3021 TaxID=114890 RepID=A0AC35TVH1_9BILA
MSGDTNPNYETIAWHSAPLFEILEQEDREVAKQRLCQALLTKPLFLMELRQIRMISRLLNLMKGIDQKKNLFGYYNAVLARYCSLMNLCEGRSSESQERFWGGYMNDLKSIYGPTINSGNMIEQLNGKARQYDVIIPGPSVASHANVLTNQTIATTNPSEKNIHPPLVMIPINDAEGGPSGFFACPVDPKGPIASISFWEGDTNPNYETIAWHSAPLFDNLEREDREVAKQELCQALLTKPVFLKELLQTRMISRLLNLMKGIDQKKNLFGYYNAVLARYCRLMNLCQGRSSQSQERFWGGYMNDLKSIYGPTINSGNMIEQFNGKARQYDVIIPGPSVASNANILTNQIIATTNPSERNVYPPTAMNPINDAEGGPNGFFACPVDPKGPNIDINGRSLVNCGNEQRPITPPNHLPSTSSSNQQVTIVDANQDDLLTCAIEQVTIGDEDVDRLLASPTKQPQVKETKKRLFGYYNAVLARYCSLMNLCEGRSSESQERFWGGYMNDLKSIYGPTINSGNMNEQLNGKARQYDVIIPGPSVASNANVLTNQTIATTNLSERNVHPPTVMNPINDVEGGPNGFFACPVDPKGPNIDINGRSLVNCGNEQRPITPPNHLPSTSSSNQQVTIVDANQDDLLTCAIEQVTIGDEDVDRLLASPTKQPQVKETKKRVNRMSGGGVDETVEAFNGTIEKCQEGHQLMNSTLPRHSLLDDFLKEHFQSDEAEELYDNLTIDGYDESNGFVYKENTTLGSMENTAAEKNQIITGEKMGTLVRKN